MIQVRKSADRGHADHGWLFARHTFSFANYHDPEHMGFRSLRVMNEDVVQPGKGFGMHGHRDMEIVTYVLEGQLEHRDNMGNGEVLTPGEFQRMSAGTGVMHSEFNPSNDEPVHLYQIWLLPERRGIEPSYEQKRFPEEGRHNRLQLVAAPPTDPAPESSDVAPLRIHQDARILLGTLDDGVTAKHELANGRHAWLQVLRGTLSLNGVDLETSDGAAVSETTSLEIRATSAAEVLLFDLV